MDVLSERRIMTGAARDKVAAVHQAIAKLGPVMVALSGGVDSSLLLALAVQAVGSRNVLAVTALGPVETEEDGIAAAEVARLTGARHQVIRLDPFAIPEFPENTPQRCYFCRQQLYTALEQIRLEEHLTAILDGTIADDASDYRPGVRAAVEAGVVRPLADAGFTKAEVRAMSRELNLPTADKPASPCLASRFPYGQPITQEGLAMVAQAEAFLHSQGFPVVRVRHHGQTARIEVPADQIERLAAEPLRGNVVGALRSLGYAYVCVDLLGFRSGSLNEVLPRR
jgi:uncharacterized protein